MAGTMEVMQKVADIEVETAGETNGLNDALLDRESDMMMMSFSDRKIQQCEQVLEDAILRAARVVMPPDELAELWRLVLDRIKRCSAGGLQESRRRRWSWDRCK